MRDVPEQLVAYSQEMKSMLRDTTPLLERPRVEDRVHEFEENIARIQADIDANKDKAAIALLEAKKDWMEQFVRAGESLLAPIRRLPREILYYIFSMCCEDGTSFVTPRGEFDVTPVPFTLSMVCARWREVAVSSGVLWSDMQFLFRFVGNSGVDAENERSLRIVEMFLERAGNSLLCLSLRSIDRTTEIPGSLERILHTLCRRASQWGSVSFRTLSPSFIRQSAFELITGNLCNLHTIVIDEEYDEEDNSNDPFTSNFFGLCPALRKAELRLHVERPGGSQTLPIPWAQLTSLKLVAGAPAPSQILPLCSNLTDLELQCVSGYAGGVRDIVMPTLRSLSVEMTCWSETSAVCRRLLLVVRRRFVSLSGNCAVSPRPRSLNSKESERRIRLITDLRYAAAWARGAEGAGVKLFQVSRTSYARGTDITSWPCFHIRARCSPQLLDVRMSFLLHRFIRNLYVILPSTVHYNASRGRLRYSSASPFTRYLRISRSPS
ncbi:hypothetical protein V5O48_014929 [Marasmius crinis-equi]|uniref:F-box domain-containing protein n=1 Tax=Marasmius crinis-equi TaxID=585013 RepID=A0ABR3EVX2_9AGAR